MRVDVKVNPISGMYEKVTKLKACDNLRCLLEREKELKALLPLGITLLPECYVIAGECSWYPPEGFDVSCYE